MGMEHNYEDIKVFRDLIEACDAEVSLHQSELAAEQSAGLCESGAVQITCDRIGPLHYCTAGEFEAIDERFLDDEEVHQAILAFMKQLPKDWVVILYIA